MLGKRCRHKNRFLHRYRNFSHFRICDLLENQIALCCDLRSEKWIMLVAKLLFFAIATRNFSQSISQPCLRDKHMLSMEHMTSLEHKSACRISFHQSEEVSQYISGQYKLQLRLFLFSVFLLFSNPKYLSNLRKYRDKFYGAETLFLPLKRKIPFPWLLQIGFIIQIDFFFFSFPPFLR